MDNDDQSDDMNRPMSQTTTGATDTIFSTRSISDSFLDPVPEAIPVGQADGRNFEDTTTQRGDTLFQDKIEQRLRNSIDSEKLEFVPENFVADKWTAFFFELFNPLLWFQTLAGFMIALLIFEHYYKWGLTAICLYMIIYYETKQNRWQTCLNKTLRALRHDKDKMRRFLHAVQAPQAFHDRAEGDDKTEWLNDIIHRFWPYVNSIVQEQIDKKGFARTGLKLSKNQTLFFERFTLGDKPPRIIALKLNKELTHSPHRIVIDTKVIYTGNCLLSFTYKHYWLFPASAGAKDVFIRGNGRLTLTQILEHPPFIGSISFTLLDKPSLDFTGLNLANLTDNQLFKNFMVSMISRYLVQPANVTLQIWNPDEDLKSKQRSKTE